MARLRKKQVNIRIDEATAEQLARLREYWGSTTTAVVVAVDRLAGPPYTDNPPRMCGRCHTCGRVLRRVLDGEEWCDKCGYYRRYRSHGWVVGAADAGNETCPPAPKEGDDNEQVR